jgi:hypothetical protein
VDAIAGFIIFIGVMFALLFFGVGLGQVAAAQKHEKDKKEKLALMEKYPHLAGDILKSIETQEDRYKQQCDKFQATMSDAFRLNKKREVKRKGFFSK